jgi:uncharacterized protein (DUF58 family)
VSVGRGWRWPWRSRAYPSDGEGRSRFHGGGGIEFAEHRPYAQGEDPRHVDWGLYARTGRLFSKVRENETGHRISLLFDGSASMEVEGGIKGKLARELAAALAQTFVTAGDSCRVIEFAEGLHRRSSWIRGRARIGSLAAFLAPHDSPRTTNWTRSFQELQTLDSPSAPVIIVSDFWGGNEMGDALRNLAASGREMVGIQILSESEAHPTPGEMIRWRDSESGETLTLRPDALLCREYADSMRKRNEFLSSIFRLRGGTFLTLTTALNLREALSKIRDQALRR